MTIRNTLKLTLCAGAMLVLTACATTEAAAPTAAAAEKAAPVTVVETANELSATQNVTKSADGNVKCKRQPVVGSNFKRKVCMTQAQWDQMEAESRSATGSIQRGGRAPGTGN